VLDERLGLPADLLIDLGQSYHIIDVANGSHLLLLLLIRRSRLFEHFCRRGRLINKWCRSIVHESVCLLVDYCVRRLSRRLQTLRRGTSLVFVLLLAEGVGAFINLAIQFFLICGFERDLAGQHDK